MDEITPFGGDDFAKSSPFLCPFRPIFGPYRCEWRVEWVKTFWRVEISGWHTGCPVKKRRLRRSFPPPCGQAVFVTENISRNGKHSLLSPEHIMFRGLKNGSNITSRSRLFAGQSEEANHPFPKPTSGIKSTKKGRSGGVLFKKADWLTEALTDCDLSWKNFTVYAWCPDRTLQFFDINLK